MAQAAGISSVTLAKLSKGESVTVEFIGRICAALDCRPGDIMEYVPDVEEKRIDKRINLQARRNAREKKFPLREKYAIILVSRLTALG
jgi:transcriptional regulator with XRE-family HTH domain